MSKDRLDHWLYWITPRYTSEIWSYKLLFFPLWMWYANPLDGIFGDSPGAGRAWWAEWGDKPAGLWRAARWWVRNPLHFIFHYVIGFNWLLKPGEKFSYRPLIHTSETVDPNSVWVQGEEGFSLGVRGWCLPFVTYRAYSGDKHIEFYAGYREKGNLGFAFRINKDK